MDESKQEVIERVAEKYTKLNESKQMYILGIMEGYQIAKEEEKKTAQPKGQAGIQNHPKNN